MRILTGIEGLSSATVEVIKLLVYLFASFIIFAAIYQFIYSRGNGRNDVLSDPTFIVSSGYNSRRITNAQNDLLIRRFGGVYAPVSWHLFSPWISYQNPNETAESKATRERIEQTIAKARSNIPPEELVEKAFLKYGDVYFQIGVGIIQRFSNMNMLQIQMQTLRHGTLFEKLLGEADAKELADKMPEYFSMQPQGSIKGLGEYMKNSVDMYAPKSGNPGRLKHLFYGHVLAGISDSITFSMELIQDRLTYWDFLYFSVVAGTTTGFGDIVPVSGY